MQKTLIGVLGASTVALGVMCAVQWKQLRAGKERVREVEQALRAESEAREQQTVRMKELEHNAARLDGQVQQFAMLTTMLRANENRQASNLTAIAEQLQTARQGTEGNQKSGTTGESKDGPFGKGMGEMIAKMMKDPDMREMMRGQQKAAISMMYSGLFKELNLSAVEKEKLMGLLTDAQMKQMENAQAIFGQDGAGSGEDPTKSLEDSKKEMDAEMKALLGEERFAQYEDYQKNVGERMQLNQLKNHLEAQNLPLQEQQTAQLLQVMKEEKTKVPPVIPTDNTQMPKKDMFTAENLDKQMQWMDDYNRRMLERAEQFLTPEQLAQYRQFQDQQASMQKFGLKMAREMFGEGKGPVAAGEATAK